MDHETGAAGATVTVFGGSDPLDHALAAHLERRGCRTHVVSVPAGWLRSATHAVIRLDTAAGAQALHQLAETSQPPSHVVAVCPEPVDESMADHVREMCRTCGMRHDVSLIWHPPLDIDEPSAAGSPTAPATTNALAATVADELVEDTQVEPPSFDVRPFVPADDPH